MPALATAVLIVPSIMANTGVPTGVPTSMGRVVMMAAGRNRFAGKLGRQRVGVLARDYESIDVSGGPIENLGDVRSAAVVAKQGLLDVRDCPGGAEMTDGCVRCVEVVVWIRDAVAVAIGTESPPRRRDELHWPDGTVPDRVAVVDAIVGVWDAGCAVGTVERDANDWRSDSTVHPECRASVSAVVRLDLADRSEYLPWEARTGRRRLDVERDQSAGDVGNGFVRRIEHALGGCNGAANAGGCNNDQTEQGDKRCCE